MIIPKFISDWDIVEEVTEPVEIPEDYYISDYTNNEKQV